MSWKSEARQIMQSKYGQYCNMCTKLGIEKSSYTRFTLELYDETKIKLKGQQSAEDK